MDSEGVFTNLDYLGSSGVVLSVEQRATLQSSLVLLRREHKFRRVKLWGVIRGIQKDYFIAQGVGMDELKDRKALYSQDCLQWSLLPHVDEGLKQKSSLLESRFTGDPSFDYEHSATYRVGEGESAQEQTTQIEMKEVDRLAAVVALVDEEGAVVPRGAYLKTPQGVVTLNNSFNGLPLEEAKNLGYYMHFRKETPDNKQTQMSITQSIGFLNTVEKDIPKDCWSLHCDQGGASVVLRSLLWLGLVVYHVPNTPNFGYFYCGTGEKNRDLLFML